MQYGYGTRFYNPEIGIWGGIDPLAEKYYDILKTQSGPCSFVFARLAKSSAVAFVYSLGHTVQNSQRYLNLAHVLR